MASRCFAMDFCNEANPENPSVAEKVFLGHENEGEILANVAQGSDGWVRLCAWGSYPIGEFTQVITRETGVALANSLKSLFARAVKFVTGRKGPPVYIGHPDQPGFAGKEGHDNHTPLGHVTAIEPRDDGVYAQIAWANEADAVRGKGLRVSPRWVATPESEHSKTYFPIRLLSIGLTYTPNIPTAGFANSGGATAAAKDTNHQHNDTMPDWLKTLLAKLNISDTNETEASARADGLLTAANSLPTITAERDTARAALTTAQTALANAEATRTKAETDLANARKEAAEALLATAVAEKRIAATEREGWATRFATDYAATATALANAKPALPNGSGQAMGTRHNAEQTKPETAANQAGSFMTR